MPAPADACTAGLRSTGRTPTPHDRHTIIRTPACLHCWRAQQAWTGLRATIGSCRLKFQARACVTASRQAGRSRRRNSTRATPASTLLRPLQAAWAHGDGLWRASVRGLSRCCLTCCTDGDHQPCRDRQGRIIACCQDPALPPALLLLRRARNAGNHFIGSGPERSCGQLVRRGSNWKLPTHRTPPVPAVAARCPSIIYVVAPYSYMAALNFLGDHRSDMVAAYGGANWHYSMLEPLGHPPHATGAGTPETAPQLDDRAPATCPCSLGGTSHETPAPAAGCSQAHGAERPRLRPGCWNAAPLLGSQINKLHCAAERWSDGRRQATPRARRKQAASQFRRAQ